MIDSNLCRFDPVMNEDKFFRAFAKKFSLDYVKQIIKGVVVIPQSWGDLDTFSKLACIYSDRPIVAYPSNIIEFVNPRLQIDVLRCIHALNPQVSLCTNYEISKKKPTRCYVFDDSSPCVIADAMGLGDEVRMAVTAGAELAPDESSDPDENDSGGPPLLKKS